MKKTTILILCTLLAFLFISCAPDSTPTPATPTPPPTGQGEVSEADKAMMFLDTYQVGFSIPQAFDTIFSEAHAAGNNNPLNINNSNKLEDSALPIMISSYCGVSNPKIKSSEINSGIATVNIDESTNPKTYVYKIENAKFTVTFETTDTNGETKETKKEFNLSFYMSHIMKEKVTEKETKIEESDITFSITINGKNTIITFKGNDDIGFIHATINEMDVDVKALNAIIHPLTV